MNHQHAEMQLGFQKHTYSVCRLKKQLLTDHYVTISLPVDYRNVILKGRLSKYS